VSQINRDLTNLLASNDIAIVLVGGDLTIRRFTPAAEKIFGLISHDVGRPLANINPSVAMPDLVDMVKRVMVSPQALEGTVTDRGGQNYKMRVDPCKLAVGKIDGVVVTVIRQ
jgi:two-component system, chemotaxis family, CheB/CheR fusion protein